MNKKTILFLSVAAIAFIIWGVRVYNVNAGVAREYEIKTYQLGETILLDNATFRVTDLTSGQVQDADGYESFPLTVEMELQNTSDKDISVIRIIEAKLAYGIDYYQTNEGDFDASQLQSLPPGSSVNFILTYHVEPNNLDKNPLLYIDQSLYSDQVNAKYKEGLRYGVAVELKNHNL
ncbi:hypothetical protein CU633_05055 [Bacillus sp. V3-13]|uniref:hypothetical protein n=1 Tax=Bacillus sp. V3-13 TaxID=2053728 RepID=UPI000C7705DC|nr:hypothetical protein [Bacillus sp. V3-13]PLR78598.1 hypothetical protein CU633_05055 [Bacillus sp. V3-13]